MNRGTTDKCTQLLLKAQAGDVHAFADLYAALNPVVDNFIAALHGQLCQHEREDLVHDVFLVVWQNLPKYRGEASAKTFALAIAKRTALKAMATRQRLSVATGDLSGIPSPESASSVDTDSNSNAIAKIIEKAMSQLTEVQRQAIDLIKVRGIPRSEALKLANCSPNQFANRLRRAVITLRHQLGELRCLLL